MDVPEVVAGAKDKAVAAASAVSEAVSAVSLVGISAAVLAAVALVGVTTDGLPVVVRNQPVAFATGVAVCVFIVAAASSLGKVEGSSGRAALVRGAGVALAATLAWLVYMAAWGATEATAARLTVTFTGEGKELRYAASVTADLLPSDDMLTVLTTRGSRDELASCGALTSELADEQPRRGVDLEPYDETWATVARVGPDTDGTATWSTTGAAAGDEALCIKAVVPARCALGRTDDEGRCWIGSEAKETFWLVDLATAAGE